MAKDVCEILGTEAEDVSKILDWDEQKPIMGIIRNLNNSEWLQKNSRIISEPGLYSLILRSRKPEAKSFKRWITHDVLPAIRKRGMYATPRTIEAMLANLSEILTGSALSAHYGPAGCARNKFFPCKPKKGYPD